MSGLHALRGRIGGVNDAGFAMTDKASVSNRNARQEWLNEQLEERKKQRLKGEEETRLELEASRQRLWSPFVREVARTHELNIAWKGDLGVFSWDRVLGLEDLAALRITGHSLSTLPNALAHSLSSLTVLSLIANGLEVLPDNIGELTLLTELDLTKNQLRRLPDSLTTLPCLKLLNLSANLLEELPEDFGNLGLLNKLWCEHNRLTTLPVSIGRSRAKIANFNANLITELPDTISEMENLTALSVNMNQLHEFPESLSLMPKLTSLHASQNQIAQLPHNIGALQSLRELRLDWNLVKQLPFSFRLLTKLQTLCMEKNPLRLPPIEYVIKGIPATLAFMEHSLEEFIRNARRKIIEHLQEILHFAMKVMTDAQTQASEVSASAAIENQHQDEDLSTILALFEPNCERVAPSGDETLAFFAVVWDEFYSTLLPALERKKTQVGPEHPSFKFTETFTVDEVEDALTKYDDDFGVASMRDFAEFRKCCCIDAVELAQNGVRKRKVCIPGQVPYRCRRTALLVRMQMMTHEEAKDQLASTYLKKKIERLVAKTKRKCVEYINSEPGVEHFEKLAHELAKKLCLKRKRLKKLRVAFVKESQAFAKKKQKLQAKVDAFRKARDVRLQELRGKVEKLEKDKVKFEGDENGGKRDVKRIEKIEMKLRKLEKELSEEPAEEKKILELEIALESIVSAELKAAVANDRARAKEERDSDGEAEDSDEDEESSATVDDGDGDDPGNSEDDEESDSEEEEEEEEEEDKPLEPIAAPAVDAASGGTKFFQIDMPELKFVDYRKAAARAIERDLTEERVVNEEELVQLFQSCIRDAYVTEKCERVSQKATYEFLQMRTVLKRWMGLGNRAVFEAWRDLMRTNRENADKLREKRERRQLVEQQNRALQEQLEHLEANKWAQRTDMYTDAVYYEHTVTGETSWYPPKYWEEEQEKQSKPRVPTLKLPPI